MQPNAGLKVEVEGVPDKSAARSRVICVAGAKGGSGKTVLAATFGTLLSGIGKRVLLIDTDAATNGLTLLYLNEVVDHRDKRSRKSSPALGTYELAQSENAQGADLVALTPTLKLLPATYSFFNSEDVAISTYSKGLKNLIQDCRPSFDYIFLDAQAGSDHFAHAAMRRDVSDKVLLVTEYDPLSAAGVERLKALFPDDLGYERIWILLNKMLPDIATRYGEFLEVARYLPPIPWTADVVRAYSRRSLALDLDQGNDYTVAVCRTLGALLDRSDAKSLEEWLSHKAVELRVPIVTRIEDLRKEQRLLDASQAQVQRYRKLARLGVMGVVVAGIIATLAWSFVGERAPVSEFLVLVLGVAAMVALSFDLIGPPALSDRALRRRQELQVRIEDLEGIHNLADDEIVSRRTAKPGI